jgi:hypothetical protein
MELFMPVVGALLQVTGVLLLALAILEVINGKGFFTPRLPSNQAPRNRLRSPPSGLGYPRRGDQGVVSKERRPG